MVVFGISSRSSLYIHERCVSKQKETYDVWRGSGSFVHHQYVWSRSRRLRPLRFLRTENNVGEEFLFSFFPSFCIPLDVPGSHACFILVILNCISLYIYVYRALSNSICLQFPTIIYIHIYIYIYIHAIFMMNFHLLNSYTYFKKFRYFIFWKQ